MERYRGWRVNKRGMDAGRGRKGQDGGQDGGK
jgi:hypothetical protein